MSTSIQEDLAGIAVIKHYTLEPTRKEKFRGLNDEYLTDGERELVDLIHSGLINRDDDEDVPF